MLEYWSGGGAVVLRVGGLATNVRHVGLSIFGNIQPKVLAGFIGDGDDNNGKFARFDFVQQPLSATELFEDAPSIDLSPMLTAIIRQSFNSKYRPTTGVIREWFGQLVTMGYGLVDAIRGTFSLQRPQPFDGVYPEPFGYAQDKLRRRAQGKRPKRPQNDSNACQEPVENVDTNEKLTELVSFVRVAIAENDPALAKNIQTVLTEVCGSGAVDRQQVWAALTNNEQQALTLLLNQPEPQPQQLDLFPQNKKIERDERFSTEAEDWS